MAIINAFDGSKAKKSSGNKTYRTVQGRLIASEKVTENSSKSIAQVGQRVRFKFASMYAELMKPIIDHSFVKRSRYASSTNAFTAEAVKNALMVPAALKSVLDGGSTKYMFLPQRALVSKGSLAEHSYETSIKQQGNITTAYGGFFTKLPNVESYITAFGLLPGQMVTLLAVVLDAATMKCALAFCRAKCVSSTELEVVANNAWTAYLGGLLPWNDCDIVAGPTTAIVAASQIFSIDSAAGFDCGTSEMAVLSIEALKANPVFSDIEIMTKEDFAKMSSSAQYYWLTQQGYAVDKPLLLDPDSIEGGDEPGPVPPTPGGESSLNIASMPSVGGTTEGSGYHENGVPFQIKATANPGYHFLRWDDGDTNATRTITINTDTVMTAYFEED